LVTLPGGAHRSLLETSGTNAEPVAMTGKIEHIVQEMINGII
jgi:hypothetical protein